jgi:hypothetical protein
LAEHKPAIAGQLISHVDRFHKVHQIVINNGRGLASGADLASARAGNDAVRLTAASAGCKMLVSDTADPFDNAFTYKRLNVYGSANSSPTSAVPSLVG